MGHKICTACAVRKPATEFHRASKNKSGRVAKCKKCVSLWSAKFYVQNKARILVRNVTWSRNNPGARKRIGREWRRANPAASRAWDAANSHKLAGFYSRWQKTHPHIVAANSARRRAKRRCATPAWANQAEIQRLYEIAARRSRLTGFKWHVDHQVPLRHPLVSGLHVENNLQVLPAKWNMSKGNRWWPDMPGVTRG